MNVSRLRRGKHRLIYRDAVLSFRFESCRLTISGQLFRIAVCCVHISPPGVFSTSLAVIVLLLAQRGNGNACLLSWVRRRGAQEADLSAPPPQNRVGHVTFYFNHSDENRRTKTMSCTSGQSQQSVCANVRFLVSDDCKNFQRQSPLSQHSGGPEGGFQMLFDHL